MNNDINRQNRRTFLRRAGQGALGALGTAGIIETATGDASAVTRLQRDTRAFSANDQIQIAVIGTGGMGSANVNTALKIPGVKIVAACDCYDGRLTSAKESWGDDLFTTRDYREILAREDVDAVIVGTPDHWHQRISIEAMRSGKSVYCEKPMVHKIEEGADLIKVSRETGKTFQVGSQGMSSLGNQKARELYLDGAIGELNYAEGFWARNSPVGAWQYAIPEDASEETCDWDMFVGKAEKRDFDPVRFFRWRNYRDYGTGVSGDLFVHLFSSLHYVVGAVGPNRISATGGLRYWKDGREVPDVLLGMFDYAPTEAHPAFNLSLRVNFVDGTSGSTFLRLVGNEGAMDIEWSRVVLRRNKLAGATDVFADAKGEELKALHGERKQMLPPAESVYLAEDGYWGAHYDHHLNFLTGVREGTAATEDAVFGLRAAAPALACNNSYFEDRLVKWDPVKMRLI
ncbi:MAG: Gfo/Idh/MocA family oxidoreductase [Rhodothermales bacterium]|nr:Gfo/Idh/MocA family oxidoreductase [Rhodothermales bacterium]